jgi:4-hydroxy-tetrahydrodipicolinate reductase
MNAVRLGILGASGKMGQEILEVAQQDKRFVVAKKLGPNHSIDLVGRGELDCVIDFSSPDGLLQAIEWCTAHGCPLVSGTTGIDDFHREKMAEAASQVAILWASNMSVGVHKLLELLENLSGMEDYDFQIEEVHHRHKKDAPSGTAITMQETLQGVVSTPLPPPLSIRGGGVFGIHRVLIMGEEETLVLEHQALRRTVFAKGALKAAHWIVNQKPGLYGMREVLIEKS